MLEAEHRSSNHGLAFVRSDQARHTEGGKDTFHCFTPCQTTVCEIQPSHIARRRICDYLCNCSLDCSLTCFCGVGCDRELEPSRSIGNAAVILPTLRKGHTELMRRFERARRGFGPRSFDPISAV